MIVVNFMFYIMKVTNFTFVVQKDNHAIKFVLIF